MATVHDCKLIQRCLPSLFHLSAVKVAFQIYKDFSFCSLEAAFEYVQKGTRMPLLVNRYGCGKYSMWIEIKRAREELLSIPGHLRKDVMEAVYGLHSRVLQWMRDHPDIAALINVKSSVCWRSDGTIDRKKTARQLILNVTIDIRNRFELACRYCFEDSIKPLWAEIEASGNTENYETVENPVVRFWIQWIGGGCRESWRRAAAEFYASFPHYFDNYSCSTPFSAFFSALPKRRQEASQYLRYSVADDFLQCLFATTKEEEEEILKKCALLLLNIYTAWPLRRLLLETTEKILKFINARYFTVLLKIIFDTKEYWKNFDHYELFLGLWNMSPIHFRQVANQNPDIREKISSSFKDMRKAHKIKRIYSRI